MKRVEILDSDTVSRGDGKYHPIDTENIENLTPVDVDMMLYLANRKRQRKSLVFELIIVYLPFVVFMTMFMFFGYRITDGFWLHEGMRGAHIDQEMASEPSDFSAPNSINRLIVNTFRDITTVQDYYDWMSGTLCTNLWVDTDYNDEFLARPRQQMVYFGAKAIGSMRVRQLRVKKDTCSLVTRFAPKLPNFDQSCYDSFEESKMDTASFGGSSQTFEFFKCKDIGNGDDFHGRVVDPLPCGGHTFFVPFANTSVAKTVMSSLQGNNWIDKQTRAVLHEAWTYNTNLNYFTSLKYAVEFTRGGNLVPSVEIKSIRMNPFRDSGSIVYLVFSLLLVLYTLIYCYIFIVDMKTVIKQQGFVYFWIQFDTAPFINTQTILDFSNLILILLTLIVRLIIAAHPSRIGFNLENLSGEIYPENLELMLYWTKIDEVIVTVSVLTTYLKATKYFKIIEILQLLINTLSMSILGVLTVLASLIVFLLGFGIAGYTSFGFDLDNFKDMSSAMSILIRMLIGEGNYQQAKEENRIIFPMFFVAFQIFGFFVIFNMFVSIISDAIGDAHKKSLVDDSVLSYVPEYAKSLREFVQTVMERPMSSAKDFEILQGDEEVLIRLKRMREAQGASELYFEDLQEAYPDAPSAMLTRILWRYDRDNSGSLEIAEIEQLLNSKSKKEPSSLDKLKLLEKKISLLKQKLKDKIESKKAKQD